MMKKIIKSVGIFSLLMIIASATTLNAQIPQTPLEACSYKNVTSHEALLSYVYELANKSSHLEIENIGTSVQSRIIPMLHVLQKGSKPKAKVLLFCQQHGNEPSGKEAALLLLKKLADVKGAELYPNLDLYIIPSVNPDGNEAQKRYNANGVDLNRNHLLLSEPEVIALHKVYEKLQPEITLDVHEYSAYRKEFREAGYFRTADEQFGAPTNLNISKNIIEFSLHRLFPYLETELNKRGVIFSNYYKMNTPDDTVRASTTSIDDGRQSFAILNTFSFILEGKNGRKNNDELERRSSRQLAAIEAFLSFSNRNSKAIADLVHHEKQALTSSKAPAAMQMDYVTEGPKIALLMRTIEGKDTTVALNYSPEVKIFQTVERPKAYVIPAAREDVIALLAKHGIQFTTLTAPKEVNVQIYTVQDITGKWMENKPTKYVTTSVRNERITLQHGDYIVSLNNVHSTMLAIALEPASMWGLVQYDEFPSLVKKGTDYPIYRILNKKEMH